MDNGTYSIGRFIMPRKKTETAVAETEKVTAAEKKTAKKTAEKKTAAKTAEKKTAAKKTAEKKTVAKKTTEKKPAAKKTTAKKAAAKKAEAPVVNKQSIQHYEDVINWKKGEAHGMEWLYIEINAGELLTEVEAGVDNLDATCKAMLNCMLEGDGFIVEPKEENKISDTLTVRYYCDNLSPERKKYFSEKFQ